MLLEKNSLIEWLPAIEVESKPDKKHAVKVTRVLRFEADGAWVIEIDAKKGMPYWVSQTEIEAALEAGTARILEIDLYDYLRRPENEILEKHRQKRDEHWALIQALVETETGQSNPAIFDSRCRGELIAAVAANQTYDARKFIYNLLRRYWQRGQMINALLPDYDLCGGRGKRKAAGKKKRGAPSLVAKMTGQPTGINVDELVKKRLRLGLKEYYEDKGEPFSKAVRNTLQKYFNNGYCKMDGGDVPVPIIPSADELPTERQARYLYETEFQPERDVIARVGQKRFDLEKRPILGTAIELAFGPGSLAEVDATLGDIFLVSELDRTHIIGRPIIYSVSDVFSKMVLGFAIVLDNGAGWPGMMLALENAMTDKVAFCARYGVCNRPR